MEGSLLMDMNPGRGDVIVTLDRIEEFLGRALVADHIFDASLHPGEDGRKWASLRFSMLKRGDIYRDIACSMHVSNSQRPSAILFVTMPLATVACRYGAYYAEDVHEWRRGAFLFIDTLGREIWGTAEFVVLSPLEVRDAFSIPGYTCGWLDALNITRNPMMAESTFVPRCLS